MNRMMTWITLALLLHCSVQAQDSTRDDDQHTLAVGLVAISASSVYTGGETQTRVFPAINYRYRQFFIEGNELGLGLFRNSQWQWRAGLGTDLAGDVDRGDSAVLEDLPDLSLPINAFVSAEYTAAFGQFRLGYAAEINNKHDGDQWSFRYSAPFSQGRWLLIPQASITAYSDEAIDYFFAVRPEFATPERPAHGADSEQVIELGLTAIRPLNARWTLFGNLSWQHLGDAISDSPIVDEDDRLSLFAGFTWTVF